MRRTQESGIALWEDTRSIGDATFATLSLTGNVDALIFALNRSLVTSGYQSLFLVSVGQRVAIDRTRSMEGDRLKAEADVAEGDSTVAAFSTPSIDADLLDRMAAYQSNALIAAEDDAESLAEVAIVLAPRVTASGIQEFLEARPRALLLRAVDYGDLPITVQGIGHAFAVGRWMRSMVDIEPATRDEVALAIRSGRLTR